MQAERTCDERIGGELESRLQYLSALEDLRGVSGSQDVENLSKYAQEIREEISGSTHNPDKIAEAAQEATYETPLSVEVLRTVRIDLSTGGPADWLEITLRDGEPIRAEYVFQDWFDGARRTLEGDQFDTAVEFARFLTADFYFPES